MISPLLLVVLAQTVTPVRVVAPVDGGTPISVQVVGTVATSLSGVSTAANQTTIGNQTTKINDGTDTALVSGTGSLQVTCDNCGGASPFEDNDAFIPGTSAVANAGLEVDDTATTNVSENSAGAQRMTPFRSAHTVIRDGAGNERSANVNASNQLEVNVGTLTIGTFPDNEPVAQGTPASSANRWKVQLTDGTDDALVSAAGALVVDGSGVTQPVSLAAFPDNEPFNLNQLAGTAISSGVGASGAGTQRTASLIHDGTDTLLISAGGAALVDGSAVTQPVSIAAAVTVAQATASSLNAEVQGDAAHAATASGNPLLAGAYAENDAAALDSTGVVEGEATRLKADLEGRLLVTTAHPFRFHANSGLSTATTLTQIQAAPGAGVSLYITDIVMSASVASTTTTDQQLTLKYGTGSNCATGTTYITACFSQANGGCAVNFQTPIKLAANTALCWIHAAAGSKVISVTGFTAP